MKIIKEIKISLIEDRNTMKWYVTLMNEGKYFGFIRPASVKK
ncbi:MAG: hypothetical protein QXW01_01735 [Candidatus Aenigmatarchaeota archaeon]